MNQLRSRLVNFRVTDEEFRRLKTASTLTNARCLSDYARSVILQTAGATWPADLNEGVSERLMSFDRRLSLLEANVAKLVEALTPAGAPSISGN